MDEGNEYESESSASSSSSNSPTEDGVIEHSDASDPVDAWKEPKIIAMDETVGNVRSLS